MGNPQDVVTNRPRGRGWSHRSSAALVVFLASLVVLPGVTAMSPQTTTLKAPYHGSVGSPTTYASQGGCARALAPTPKWAPGTGFARVLDSGRAVACAHSVGGVGQHTSTYAFSSLFLAIPLRVSASGNHSIGLSWTMNLTTALTMTTGGCPKKTLHFPPPRSTYLQTGCADASNVYLSVQSYVQDLNNNSWNGANSTFGDAYRDRFWQNISTCSNFGTPSCSNSSGNSSYGGTYGGNDPGFNGFPWTGSTSFTLWNNATRMLKSHHYVLLVTYQVSDSVSTDFYDLSAPWAGLASVSIDMSTLGNGATLHSITIS